MEPACSSHERTVRMTSTVYSGKDGNLQAQHQVLGYEGMWGYGRVEQHAWSTVVIRMVMHASAVEMQPKKDKVSSNHVKPCQSPLLAFPAAFLIAVPFRLSQVASLGFSSCDLGRQPPSRAAWQWETCPADENLKRMHHSQE